jgi:hypothetical protein
MEGCCEVLAIRKLTPGGYEYLTGSVRARTATWSRGEPLPTITPGTAIHLACGFGKAWPNSV